MKGQLLQSNFLKLSLIWLCSVNLIQAQQTLQVLDEVKDPLIGVTVLLDGIPSESTDLDGKCVLDLSKFNNLSLSFLGYEELGFSKPELQALEYIVQLKPVVSLIEEVLIVGRTNALASEMPFNVETIGAKEISLSQAQTTADAIGKSGNVYIQKSQMGGGSPVLRGFEANKILLVVDGVRMNNAIYRSGHLQNAITIDPAILNRAELIFGPGSLLYGSDAIGGVIHFRTKDAIIDAPKMTGGSYLRYGSANQEKTAHVHFTLSNQKNFASLTSISFSDFGDLTIGKNSNDAYPDWGKRFEYIETADGEDFIIENEDPFTQVGTGYLQFDILEKLSLKVNDKLDLGLNLQLSRSSNIPRYDFLSEYRNGELRFAEWNYGPQQRFMVSPNLDWRVSNNFFDQLMVNTSYQKIEESRITRNLSATDRNNQIESLQVLGVNVDLNKKITKRSYLEYGGSMYYNALLSEAYSENILTGITNNNILTRYPSEESSLRQMGIYLHHRYDLIQDKLFWNLGTRWSNQESNFVFKTSDPIIWPDYYYNGIENNNHSLVWMTGLNYNGEKIKIKALAGSAFRAPNIDDLAKVRVKTDEITIPNPDLKPEKTVNGELNINYVAKKTRIGVSAFYSSIQDIVVRDNFKLPNGDTQYSIEGDTLEVTANVNAEQGQVTGISLNLEQKFLDQFTLTGTLNYVKGITIQENTESPLDHIPPTYGKLALRHEVSNWTNSLVFHFNGEKPIDLYGGSTDNPEYALSTGTPAWQTINLYSNYQVNKNFKVSAAIENILDKHYRPFASGVSAPGRNIIFSLHYNW